MEKLKRYTRDIHICGERNSYCKTYHDAMFMQMKEDHMRNGQLKPGYNLNAATASGFIIGHYISPDRDDVQTLIPFVTKLREVYPNGIARKSLNGKSPYDVFTFTFGASVPTALGIDFIPPSEVIQSPLLLKSAAD